MNIKNEIDNEDYNFVNNVSIKLKCCYLNYVKEHNQKKLACKIKKDILIVRRGMPYEDITNELIEKAIPNNNEIPEISKYLKYNLKNATFDTKDINGLERLELKKIQNRIGGTFKLIHRVLIDGVSTPDAKYFNRKIFDKEKYFDIKSPKKSESLKSKSQKIARQFNEAKRQTNNIIISLLREGCDLSNIDAIKQIEECLNSKRYSWIENVILVGKDDLIKIYQKKKKP